MTITVRFGLAAALVLFCTRCSTPSSVHQDRAIGVAVVRVTTDAHEKIVDVTILKSTGNSTLDRHAVADTKTRWHRAVGSIEQVMVRYTPGPDGRPTPTFQLKPR